MSKILFSDNTWKEYLEWQAIDKKEVLKINSLIKDIGRLGPMLGRGKPERLVGNLSGFYSRRIDDANRLIYEVKNEVIEIKSCYGHYED